VGTTLLTIALGLAGALGYLALPVSPLPQVEFPTISVSANLPGASPETMASSVATPLERQFGRIAGVNELTSTSSLGACSITLQFDLNRNIDAAARDVQAAINAARSYLPANLPSNPSYKKVNPADTPIMIFALTSDIYDRGRMYDAASTILQQKLSQVSGVGQVTVGGGALPAVRIDVDTTLLNNMGLSLEDVRAALGAANANRPKGTISDGRNSWALSTTDQLFKANQYKPLLIAYRHGSAVRVEDVANVIDSTEDVRTSGFYAERSVGVKPAVLLSVFRQPGANIIDTVRRVRSVVPQLQAEIPPAMQLSLVIDRTTTIRASVEDVQKSLGISIALVILVVFVFLRDVRTTLIPSVAVPLSLIGTFGVMYLLGYSLDNLSLMALTISTGFVVDDAIVVIENVSRYLAQGMTPHAAAIRGVKEIGFTVISISVSLIAVFIPLLLMGGIVGRLFREFAVTLSVAIAVSLVVSLTTTPMMCATILKNTHGRAHGALYRFSEGVFDLMLAVYARGVRFVLRHQPATLLVMFATVAVNVGLFLTISKGFFPQQDTGRLTGSFLGDQQTSFQETTRLLAQFAKMISEDEGIENCIAFAGGTSNAGRLFITMRGLKDPARKGASVDVIMARLRKKMGTVPGATVYLQAYQDLRIGGISSSGLYQYTLRGDTLEELNTWAPRVVEKMRTLKGLVDVNSDQQNHGLQAGLLIDRDTASRLGITAQLADDTLYDAFGQRQVSTAFSTLNQYHVVMEADPRFTTSPEGLKYVYARTRDGHEVPLDTFSRYRPATTLITVPHSGQFPAVTLSFNLRPGMSLGDAVTEIEVAEAQMGVPETIHGSFMGTAQAFQASLASEPFLIVAALVAVYIVLGVLYESLIHPLTILSTLPSAGIGALLALMLCKTDLSVIAVIGIVLLIGIVKKNAIMLIDFAMDATRNRGMGAVEAIYKACVLRFRPITMTTMAALLGGLPLALGTGTGSELRQPLGIAIVGGLIVSQMLTLFTTPVVYLYMDRLVKAVHPAIIIVSIVLGGPVIFFGILAVAVGPGALSFDLTTIGESIALGGPMAFFGLTFLAAWPTETLPYLTADLKSLEHERGAPGEPWEGAPGESGPT
jgi:multidrug efflux pump